MILRHLVTKVMGCLHLPRGGTSRRLRAPLDRPLPNPGVPVALASHWVNNPFLISLEPHLHQPVCPTQGLLWLVCNQRINGHAFVQKG